MRSLLALFNGQLRRLVIDSGVELVRNAIRVVQASKKRGEVRNPAGLFRSAVKHQWEPGDGFDDSSLKDEFNEWFKLARDAELILGSQVEDGQIWVFNQTERFTYAEMLRLHPLELLRLKD
ncbi:MAG: hypothetical protein HC810_02670 [Acaryochloridaceae cyanobacterium RL_2_7]|nr:hypothetical protein [Acaryochloridaceae cyanobacterium RL_2_7]